MSKRVKALALALIMVFTTIISMNGMYLSNAYADDASIDVVFHFSGVDDLTDYRLWLWTIGDGFECPMEVSSDNSEATYTYTTDVSTIKIGFIVKKGDGWEGKDYDGDRFVFLNKVVGGTVNIYITSKTADFETNTDDATMGMKITSASTDDLENITFVSGSSVESIDDLGIKVLDTLNNDAEMEVSGVTLTTQNKDGSCKFNIALGEKLDTTGSYVIEYYNGISTLRFMIGMPDPYSNDEFENAYTYEGDDLGATWSESKTDFRVWAPLATDVKINLYKSGTEGTDDLIKQVDMTSDVKGTWVASVDGDLNGTYYTYTATVKGNVEEDIVDPYARTTGVNGARGMIVNLDSTDPEGWTEDVNPQSDKTSYTDDILYELHVRDFSYDESSGVSEANRGKFLAFTETGTTNSYGQTTGIDYLSELGITHVHILPMYDSTSIDETKLDTDQYNWGYDPLNYNVPEGSYSTDPYNGEVRINEAKQMVQSLHNAGLGMIMDVVYGHVSSAGSFCINRLTPSYYSRPNSSASGCGNDTATERSMNSKYIVDSFVYWADEYHVNGFRIDQEGLFDVDTINAATTALHKIDPSIIVYGEGWSMSSTNVTKDNITLADQTGAEWTEECAYFSDGVRDALKGSVFDTTPGYVSGDTAKTSAVLQAIVANPSWQYYPTQVVNYNSCHDNYTLYDRLKITTGNEDATDEELMKQNNFAAAIVFTCQGVPFIQAGEELLRTKPNGDGTYNENSYCGPTSINTIKWDTLNEEMYDTTHSYYQGLMALRTAHPAFRMNDEDDIDDYINFTVKGGSTKQGNSGLIAYTIDAAADEEVSNGIFVIYNPTSSVQTVDLPDDDTWTIYVQDDQAGTTALGTAKTTIDVNPCTATVLCKDETIQASVAYRTHVQKVGWEEEFVTDGETAGTVGKALRLEGIQIKLVDENGDDLDSSKGSIEYRTHVQKLGWEETYAADGATSGTVGQAKRLEAIQIKLTGDVAEVYDVYYRVQAQKFGWLGWAKNDEESGTAGFAYRLEAIQIQLVEKGGDAPEADTTLASFYDKNDIPTIQYRTHVQTYGWQDYAADGAVSGTVGKAKRLEAIQIKVADNKGFEGSIEYRTHVQKLGWEDAYAADGSTSGTSGKGYRLEAIQIRLTGELAEKFDVYYRVHAQKFGWMGWAKNDEQAGTAGYAYRLEGIQIQLLYKDTYAPGNTKNAYVSK